MVSVFDSGTVRTSGDRSTAIFAQSIGGLGGDGDMRFSREGECTWMRVSDRDVEHASRQGIPAATDYSSIINFGFQRALTANWHGGFALGFEKTDFEIPLAAERDGNQMQIGGIFKGRYGPNAIDLSTTMGRGEYQTRRFMGLPSDGDVTAGKRDIRFVSAHAGCAFNFERDNWYLRPGVALGWTDVSGDAFAETDGGPSALIVEGTDDSFLTSRIDLQFGGEFSSANQMVYRPFVRTAFSHIHSGTTNDIMARLAGAPESVPNFTQVMEVDDNYKTISFGIEMLGGENWTTSFMYERLLADRWDADCIVAKLMFRL